MMMKRDRIRGLLGAMAAFVLLPATLAAQQPQQDQQPVVTHVAVVSTSAGDVEVELYGKDAPLTVTNFVELAKKGFFDGILFHRVIPGFAVQTGDPNTRDSSNISQWGRGGESIHGGYFKDELNPSAPSYKRGYVRGTLAMSNRGQPNTNLSQFFIMLVDNSTLPRPLQPQYSIFGRVRGGWEALEKIAEGEIIDANTGRPKLPYRIIGVVVTAKE